MGEGGGMMGGGGWRYGGWPWLKRRVAEGSEVSRIDSSSGKVEYAQCDRSLVDICHTRPSSQWGSCWSCVFVLTVGCG